MILKIVLLTVILELITVIGRLAFGSAKKFYKKHKIRVRIHHGYIGLVFLFLSLFYVNDYVFLIGIVLLSSDLVHHFIVLPMWIGKTEFP